jgi:tRNA pseudouridine38-40 synthase
VSAPPDPGGRDRATVRWRLRVAYDGSGFHGFAAQVGLPTVAGALSEALSRVARTPVTLTCAGRTDSGVHALDQVVHFDVPAQRSDALDPAGLVKSCNSQVGPSIVVREAGIAPGGFDARHSATARRYRYLVVNAPVPDPLLAGLTWHVPDPLDIRAMAAAADALLGEHDFRAFCRRVPGSTPDDPIPRRVLDARWTKLDGRPTSARTAGTSDIGVAESGTTTGAALAPVVGDLLAFEIEANAFCHQMVRSLVGTLVDVGGGK